MQRRFTLKNEKIKESFKNFLSTEKNGTYNKIFYLISQIIKFCFVGATAFLIDAGILVILKEVFFVNVLWAAGISFSVSVIYNYLMSMRYVFESKDDNKKREFVIFVLLSIGGLFVNELFMWLSVSVIYIHYMLAKIVATAVVLVYNFITRKIFLEKH